MSEHTLKHVDIREKVCEEAYQLTLRSSHRRCSIKKVFSKISQNLRENTCARFFFVEASNFTKKETLAQALSCEFCKIFKNTFFTEYVQSTVSGY